jgi:hypothetical protein
MKLDDLVTQLQTLMEIDHRLQTEYRQKRWSAMPPSLRDLCRMSTASMTRSEPWVSPPPSPEAPAAHI